MFWIFERRFVSTFAENVWPEKKFQKFLSCQKENGWLYP